MEDTLLTTAAAAAQLGVSPSTIKRWVDEGALAGVRTAGGHRRITVAALEALRARLAGDDDGSPAAPLVGLLVSDAPLTLVEARLLALRVAAGSAAALAEHIGLALRDIGERWQAGHLSVVEEHSASERLARALARLVEWMPRVERAPRALLATALGDDHTLGLQLVELVLREAGWDTLWAGRNTPVAELVRTLRARGRAIRLVSLSASVVARDARRLAAEERAVGAACDEVGATLLIGGAGAWPARPRFARVVRDLGALDRVARELAAAARRP